jgi:hypothetical protein
LLVTARAPAVNPALSSGVDDGRRVVRYDLVDNQSFTPAA